MRHIDIVALLRSILGKRKRGSDAKYEKDLFVCYGKVKPEEIKGYEVVVLEAQHYTSADVKMLKANNLKVLSYLSLSEVNEYTFFYKEIEPFTHGINENWNSRYISLKTKKAKQIIVNAASKLMKKGFDGLFLDNLDNMSKWGLMANQKNDLIELLSMIKSENENMFLMQNSGIFISEELNNITDAILVESLCSAYNFKNKQYEMSTVEAKNSKLKLIKKVTNKPVFILEYASKEAMKNEIKKALDKLHYPYFIANIDLKGVPEFKNS